MTESNPIDNFFIGGDWDKFVNEIEKKELKSHLTENEAQSINNVFGKGNEGEEFVNGDEEEQKIEIESSSDSDSEPCLGKYIYIHDLPTEFNEDLLKHCKSLSDWYNMCHYMSNFGLGPRINNPDKILSNTGWFETNQFMLEVIFHNRMKQYKCLTNDSSLASAIFVPYYAGLDVARYLWNSNRLRRDFYSVRLVKWLKEKPEWKKLWGRDHFLVAGRITWDFRRLTNGNSDWGNRLMLLPESRNMTILTIESSPWSKNDFAIPYPTYFHPSSDGQIFQWQNRMRRMKRRILFSFVGAPRPNLINSIRNNIIQQCQAARKKCKMLDCASGSNKCYKPTYVMKIFQTSIFCLQPAGDSYTRRSTFDSILAGCIPVFFHPGSAYVQYLWHLPKDYTKYSVFIPGNDVRNGKANIERILSRISKAKILAMREQVLKLIPGVVYADPRSSLKILEDAFDITVDGVLERVEKIREEVEQGNEVSDDGEEFTWKKNLFGTVEKHEWDHFFDRS
ncbi:hypothetical protein JCGZ_02987 [Jatropha curcas]|uniref:Exostosin GT47 domain-containing protein n=1 Tax=Jatropha curcas TaxID=180498 RepID=A0A067L1I3_JATCU|nr:hypothetical protein JCGZ_02987 [Jatropha curcas]